jgi:hypothetical protein
LSIDGNCITIFGSDRVESNYIELPDEAFIFDADPEAVGARAMEVKGQAGLENVNWPLMMYLSSGTEILW